MANIQLGGDEQIFIQDGIGGPVTAGGQAGTFRTNVAFTSPNPPSPVSVNPPSVRNVQYEVELTATVDEESVSDTATSGRFIALYAGALDNVPASTGVDSGGDDWATVQTIEWLDANVGLLGPFVGDISGEHGRNIKHVTHKDGRDIDFR